MNSCTKKKAKVGEEQKLYLIEFLEQNPELRNGKFTSTFTYKTSQKCWYEIALQLNAVGPVQKDWKQWRKTWQDMKSKTKARSSELRKHREKTGGGAPLKDLTGNEERVLNVIGQVAVSGHPNTPSSSVIFDDMVEMDVAITHAQLDHNYNENDSLTDVANPEVLEISLTDNAKTILSENKEYNRRIDFLQKNPTITREKDLNEPHTEVTKSKIEKRYTKSRRLDNSIRASEMLAEQTATKLKLKKEYYDAKLKLLQESIEVQTKIATALEKIAESIQ